jgi:putative inorganic carbon (HCO3(-)) transporter
MEQSEDRSFSKRGAAFTQIITSETVQYFLLIAISIIAGFLLLIIRKPEVVPALAIVTGVGLSLLFYPYLGVVFYMLLTYISLEQRIPATSNLHLTRLLAMALIAVWAVRTAITKSKLYLQENGLLLLYLFFLTMALSIPLSFWPTKSFNTFVDMLKILAFVILFIHLLDTRKKLKIFLWVFLLVNCFLAVNAIKDFILLGPNALLIRVSGGGEGFLGNANDFAIALNIALPFSFYLFLREKKKNYKVLYFFFFILLTLGVISTGSRGGFLSLIVVFLYFIMKSRQKLLGFFAILLLGLAIFLFAPPEYWQRQTTITSYQQDESAMGRINSWKVGIRMFADRPLLGVGIGAYEVSHGSKYGGPWLVAHNAYIQIGAELGIFGLLLYLGLIFYIYRQATVLIAFYQRDNYLESICLGVKGALLTYAVGSFFLSVGYYPHLYLLLSIVMLVKILKEAEIVRS